jgi:2-keto-3-deoxy-L-rhamnonate aldolase RhmA
MRENRVKRALQRGETVIGTMIGEVRNPEIAQILKLVGFDFFFIDMEHGMFNMETVADIIHAARLVDIAPFVRVPNLEYHLICRPLDAGAQGEMVPRVDTVDDVRKMVRYMKYPPMGERGCALGRGHTDYKAEKVADYIQWANQENLVIVQIESQMAIDQIEEMVSVPGVDVALIGPNDLSISLGIPGQQTDPKEIEAIDKMVAACTKHGVASGIHLPNVDQLKGWMAKGMRFITYSTDLNFLMSGKAGLDALRAAAAEMKK